MRNRRKELTRLVAIPVGEEEPHWPNIQRFVIYEVPKDG